MSFENLTNIDKDDVLGAVGLSVRRTVISRVWEALGYFSAGAVVGCAAGLLLAPKSGQGLREDLSEGMRRGREKAVEKLQAAQAAVGLDASSPQPTTAGA